jgi:succinate-semialdehyde dehydrogenase/glutarate-semialdehyde dehydrogenase
MTLQAKSSYTESFNPATGELIDKTTIHSLNELELIINQAKKTQKEWEKTSVKFRAKKLIKIRNYIVDYADEIAFAISKDNGKSVTDALAAEVLAVAMAINYYCKNAPKFLSDEKLKIGNVALINKRSKIVRVPFGVIGIISPWNYPFSIPFSEIIMGLIAGNAVVMKGASETQVVSKEINKAIDSAELPHGLFNLVNMPGSVAGDAFIDSGLDKIFFTGSVEVGKYLMGKAAKSLTPIALELGGNDPMIVCDDADPYRAAMGALWGGFHNAGQSCSGVERIYVHEKIFDKFLSILKFEVEKLRIGNGSDFNIDMGCMTTKKQIDIVNAHIKDAIDKGAKIFAQSAVPNNSGNFLPATVLTNVNHEMLLMNEETFGPVVGVMKYKTDEEAIALANDSQYGLSASVWSKNKNRAEKIARQVNAGAIMINDHLMSHGLAETPWGGFKNSGIGRTHGKYGLYDKTQPKVIVHDLFSFTKKNLWWHPYSKQVYDGLKSLLIILYERNILVKIIAMKKLIKIIPRIFKKR